MVYDQAAFCTEANLSEDPAQEIVVSCEGLSHQHLRCRIGIQQSLVCCLEEALVGVETWLEELVEELPKDATTIDARLIQTMSVQQVDTNPLL